MSRSRVLGTGSILLQGDRADGGPGGRYGRSKHGPMTCLVRAYRTWIDVAGIESAPVFRSISRAGAVGAERLSDRSVALIIKKHVERLGYDPGDFAGHSLRRGFATEAARALAPERTIARTTRHTSTKGLDPYIADAEVFTDPPSRYLGLGHPLYW